MDGQMTLTAAKPWGGPKESASMTLPPLAGVGTPTHRTWWTIEGMESLRFPASVGPASSELNALLDRRGELASRLADIESSARAAVIEQREASDALAALERRRAPGDDVDDEAKRAEKNLAAAKEKANEPWAERIAGLRHAVRDHNQAVQQHIAASYPELAAELADEATEAARAVDDAIRELDRCYQAREQVHARFDAMIAAAVGRSEPGLVPPSRVQALASAGADVLLQGGERPPIARRDPRQPVAGQVVAEAWSS